MNKTNPPKNESAKDIPKTKSKEILNTPTPMKKAIREYPLITVEENHTLQVKSDNLIQRVRNSSAYIEEAEVVVKETEKVKRELKEWKQYIACDPIPRAYEPESIRQFFFKTLCFEDEDIENNVNWLLAVDERSILSQDIDAENLTKKHHKQVRGNFGGPYNIRVNDAMEVLRRIQTFLENPTKILSTRIMGDIEEVRFVAYKQINHYIDSLTYRVLCSEDAYMDRIDVTTAEYFYNADNFDIHLWTFKNVPIYLDPQDTPFKVVKLHQIQTQIVMPFSVLCENMVIRGLHCLFDHFSAHTRYSELPKAPEFVQSLRVCLQKEWESQKQIQSEVRAALIKQRLDFEEAARLKAEEEELKAKARKREEGKEGKAPPKPEKAGVKPKKPPKEPQILTADLMPNVRNDFLLYDTQNYQDAINNFHPDILGFAAGEVNLRKFQILGGVYQLNCLSKPRVTNLPKLILSWYKAKAGMEYHNIQTGQIPHPMENISKFFQITFVLPKHFCYWGEPIPCLFDEGISYRADTTDESDESKAMNIGSPVIINDFNLHELFNKPLMYKFIESSIPRIISSFKFPEDLCDDEDEKKTKATLGRSKQTAEEMEREKELQMQKQMLSFDNQNWPERLFPLFKKVLPVVILPLQEEGEEKPRTHPYENFSEFIATLEKIKESYRRSTFLDYFGKPLKILSEHYDGHIRKPRDDTIHSRFLVYEKDDTKEVKSIGSRGSMKTLSKTSLSEVKPLSPTKSEESGPVKRKPEKKKGKESGKRGSKTKLKDSATPNLEGAEKHVEHGYSKWSTANILKSEFNPQTRKVTIWTDRLGTFGFAFYRYQHFPFQSWLLRPNEDNPNEVELVIESVYAVFRIYIGPQGYRLSVTDFTKFYKSRKIYFEITKPTSDITFLKEQLQQRYLNIFPERDASFYITGKIIRFQTGIRFLSDIRFLPDFILGYFSEKHLSAENHTYNCISLYATSLKFSCSFWNKLSNRRTMVLKFGERRDAEEDFSLLRVTPEDVLFVEIKEVCTDLDRIELEYTPTWRNLEWYPDLNHLIVSSYPNSDDMRTKDQNVIYYLKNILQAIRPLSCS